MTSRRFASILLIATALVVGAHHVLAAPEHSGQVTFGGLPVPGATVTASSGDKQLVTATDEQGQFKFADTGDGVWMCSFQRRRSRRSSGVSAFKLRL